MKLGRNRNTCTAHNKGFGVMVAMKPILGICNTIEHWVNNLSLAREKRYSTRQTYYYRHHNTKP